MNLIWRFLWVILFSKFETPVHLFDESSIHFRVLPTDVDLLWHMNNGRYFSLMDLARLNFTIRNKIFPLLRKNKIYAVAASEMIRFKKSLDLFHRFEIKTKLLGWDNKFFYIAHYFKKQNKIYAISLVKGCFLHKKTGLLNPNHVLSLIGHLHTSPSLPEWVKNWQSADQDFHDETLKSHPKL